MSKNILRALVALSLILNLSISALFAQNSELPRVMVIATGGTIAGSSQSSSTTQYTAGVLTVEQILATVSGIEDIAQIQAVQFLNIASQNLAASEQLRLANFINESLADSEIDGVVVTHGTDTMEETAYLLSLLVASDKPIVLVGAMRPASGLSADGPANLYSAIVAVSAEESRGRGAMVLMNDDLILARDVVKFNTLKTNAFRAPNSSPIGTVVNSEAHYIYPPLERKCFETIPEPSADLPKVGILYGHVDSDYKLVDFMILEGYKGIVFAGVGHGNTNDATLEALARAAKSGVVVVRSSRAPTGEVNSQGEVDDAKYGFTSSQNLNANKARVLLQLSLLAAQGDPSNAKTIFDSMKF